MKVFLILFLAFFIALFNKAHSFCANGSLHADLAQAVVRSSDWMRTFYKNNETFIEPYTASSMIDTLRLAGHQPRYLLSEFKNKDQVSIDETLKDYLDRENGTNGNLTKIPTGQLAYIVQGVIAICRKPEAFEGFNLYDSLHDGLKWFKKTPTFNNYFQYSLVAIAFCNGGVQVPEIMVKELVKAARQKFSIHGVDTNALILMALSCVKKSSMSSEVDKAITKIVNHLISKQNTATGDFGNQYSTALAVQALQAARHVYTNTWLCEKAMRNILGYQDEDGSFGNILANIQVTPSLLGESLISLSKFMCSTQPSPPKKNITVSVNLVFNATATEPIVKVTTLEGTTAYKILELASKQNPCYKAEYKKYSFGRSITSICGVKANAKEGLYWFIYVDGSLAKYGVDDLKPKDGSLLSFKYQKYKAPTANQNTAFEKNITVSVNLVFNATTTEPTVKVTTLEGTTAYVILELASKQNPCYKAEYKKYSFGRFITSICGVKNNANESLYWFIYVDGSLAKYGVDDLKPKDGSLLSFKYQKHEASTTTQSTALVKSKSTTNGVSGYGIPAFARVYLMVYSIIHLIH